VEKQAEGVGGGRRCFASGSSRCHAVTLFHRAASSRNQRLTPRGERASGKQEGPALSGLQAGETAPGLHIQKQQATCAESSCAARLALCEANRTKFLGGGDKEVLAEAG
jgi:hypothetical protein